MGWYQDDSGGDEGLLEFFFFKKKKNIVRDGYWRVRIVPGW